MVIITTTIIAIALVITQVNPINIVRDNFFVPKSQAKVLGVSEVVEDNINKIENKATFSSNGFPETGFRDSRPIKKFNVTAEPEITAKSAIVVDAKSKSILFRKNVGEPSAIASITKLVTALVVLDENPDFNKKYIVKLSDRREGGRIFLFQGDEVTINDLFNITLVGSGNTATVALVNSLGMNEQEFVNKMNKKAQELGLNRTSFADPIGLSVNNKSNAYEVAKILETALAQEKIKNTVMKSSYILKTGQGKRRVIENTDNLLKTRNSPSRKGEVNYNILGGKTGYLGSAGFCFTGKFSNNNNEIITVILGSDGVNLRFSETDEIARWVYNNYIWP